MGLIRANFYFLFSGLLLVACQNSSSSGGGGNTPDAVLSSSYYIDATSGSDSNAGTSTASPWRTLAYAGTKSFASGSVLYLKRGEVWQEQLTVPSSNMTIDAYGSGANPLIDGAVSVSSWVAEGSGIYSAVMSLASGEGLGNISENGSMMSFLPWKANFTATFSSASTGTFSYDYNLAKIYIKPATAPTGNSYRASTKLYGIRVSGKSGININKIDIKNFSLHGASFSNCQGCSIKDGTIANGGGAVIATNPSAPPSYLYAGNGIEYDSGSTGGTVDGMTVSNIFDSGITPQTFASGSLVSGTNIQNSTVDKCGFTGIEISVLSNGGSTGSTVSGITVSGMVITNSGRGWSGRRYGTEGYGVRIVADAGAGTMSGIVIQTTTISGSLGDGIKLAGEVGTVTLSRLKIKGNLYGINASEASATSLKLVLKSSLIYGNSNYGIFYNSPSAAGLNIYHNTFYDNATINLAVFNQSNEAKILNNLFYSSSAMTHLYASTTLTGAQINNNCYNNVTNMFGYNSVVYSSVAAFNAATGFEGLGLGGAGIGLSSPSTEVFTLLAGSQCRGLGSTVVGVTTDYAGSIFASPPASGAYEY